MAHASKELEPFVKFRWGRNIHWWKTMWSGRRLTVWSKFFSFSVGRRFPLHDGWPE
jgi:hypothetical protein